jgi:hypothetical protein
MFDTNDIRRAVATRLAGIDWNDSLARAVKLWALISIGIAYTHLTQFYQLPVNGWSLSRVGSDGSLLKAVAIGCILGAGVLFIMWPAYRLLRGRLVFRGVDVGLMAAPLCYPFLLVGLAIGWRFISAPAETGQELTASVRDASLDAAMSFGEAMLAFALIALPSWVLVVVFLGAKEREMPILSPAGAKVGLALLLVLATVPAAAVATGQGEVLSDADTDEYDWEPDPPTQPDYIQTDRGRLACGPVEATPPAHWEEYSPAAVHNVSAPVQVGQYAYANGTVAADEGWYVHLNHSGPRTHRVVSRSTFANSTDAVNTEGFRTQGSYELSGLTAGEQTYIYWDVVHEDGTVHRYVAKLCAPGLSTEAMAR